MSISLLSYFRLWHRKIASLLFIFFFIISVTAILLGWKSYFTTIFYDNKKAVPSTVLNKWLPLDTLETLSSISINKITGKKFSHAERIELKPKKGYINFSYKDNYSIQVDGATGIVIHVEKKNGGWIQDIHDGAIIDGLVNNNSGVSKKIYSSLMGLALMFLTISGFYLWYKPRQIKQSKK